jgi:CP family cyanate transporter-like MFS transporter
MFVLVLAGTAGLAISGVLVTRNRYVDDELHRGTPTEPDAVEVAGAEPPVTVRVSDRDAGSRRG